MKVLLMTCTIPRDKIFRKSLKNLGAILPPLGLAYIASYLEKDGHEVKIIDGLGMASTIGYTEDNLMDDLSKINPDIIGISASTPQFETVNQISTRIKMFNKCPIILGGALITASPEKLSFLPNIDYGVHGEAEITFNKIAEAFKKNEDIKKIKGVIYRKGNEVKYTESEIIKNLDDIPFPSRHLLRMELYKPSPANYRRLPATNIMTSRGCPFECLYCSKPATQRTYRTHTPKRIVDEFEHLVKEYNIKDIQIFDDIFGLNQENLKEICNDIIRRKLDVGWNCMMRVDKVNPEILKLMKKAGCYEIGYGIESGSQRILNLIKKGTTIEQIRNAVRWTREAKIDSRGFFILGFPTETAEEVKATIDFAIELDVDIPQFMIATPFPNTGLHELAKQHGTLNDDLSNYTLYAPESLPFKSNTLKGKELLKLYKSSYRRFIFRPGYLLRQLKNINDYNSLVRHWHGLKGVIGL